jgi:hypothetical protein
METRDADDDEEVEEGAESNKKGSKGRPRRRTAASKQAASEAAKKHLSGWMYIVRTLFKDFARAKALYPFLNPLRTDNVDVNNLVEV